MPREHRLRGSFAKRRSAAERPTGPPVNETAPKVSGSPDSPVVSTTVSANAMRAMAGRVDMSMPVGYEGAGVVVEAGASAAAQGSAADGCCGDGLTVTVTGPFK